MSDGPTTIDTPWRRGTESLARQLHEWVTATLAPGATLGELSTPEGSGMSSETILFDIVQPDGAVRRCVARLAPEADVFPVFETYALDVQGKVMELVAAHTPVPVPPIVAYEADDRWLGTPFLVMERIDGVAPPDMPPYVFGGWLTELSAADRRALMERSVRVLAELHRITPDTHDLSFIATSEGPGAIIDELLGAQRRYYDWGRGDLRSPLIEATFAWLDAHRPERTELVLNWGDSRIGNMLYRGADPVAVLDWEMAAIGPREVDLAWMVFLHRFFQGMAEQYGFPGLPDFMDRADVVAIYEEASGHSVSSLEWFEVYAALRFAIVSVRTSLRGVHYGQQPPITDPDELIMFRPLLEAMLAGTYWS